MGIYILFTSIAVQFSAAALSFYYLRRTGYRLAWGTIAIALTLMGARRFITFWHIVSDQERRFLDTSAETVALLISLLMLAGVLLIGQMFKEENISSRNLQVAQNRFKDFAEASGDWLWETDASSRFIYLSEEVEKVTGIPVVWHLGKTREEIAGEDYLSEKWEGFRKSISEKKPFKDFRYVRQGPNQIEQVISVSGVPVFSTDGQFLGYRGIGSDVTEQERTHNRAILAEQQLIEAIEAMPDAFVYFDSSGRLIICNEQYKKTYPAASSVMKPGVSFEEILRASLEKGEVLDAVGREEEWIKERLLSHFNPSTPFEQKVDDGRVLLITEYKTKDGGIVGIRQDITRIKRHEEQIARSEARLTDAIESLGDAFAFFDADDKLIIANRKYREIYHMVDDVIVPGTTFETIIRTAVERGQYPDAIGSEEKWVANRLKQHHTDGLISEQKLDDGRWLRVLERRTSEGGVAGSRIDITELVEARDDANRANQAKSEFLAAMSHELRTPLNAILGFAQMLMFDARNPMTTEQKESLDSILHGGNHLLELINEILDLAKIEADQLTLLLEDININEVIVECVEMTRPLGKEREINVYDHECHCSGTTSIIHTDRMRLKQALINLLSNAIKFNRDQGSVTINCQDTDDSYVRISVTDTGAGIAKEDYGSVFHMFHRLDSDPMVAQEGTGIGLTVTKLLIEKMDGRIGFDSEEGVGSTFWIELPLTSI